ncbi:hypothetical protein NUSPORA_01798 [Nucleospora cyclopteri]
MADSANPPKSETATDSGSNSKKNLMKIIIGVLVFLVLLTISIILLKKYVFTGSSAVEGSSGQKSKIQKQTETATGSSSFKPQKGSKKGAEKDSDLLEISE